jgi:hypothetical protein
MNRSPVDLEVELIARTDDVRRRLGDNDERKLASVCQKCGG